MKSWALASRAAHGTRSISTSSAQKAMLRAMEPSDSSVSAGRTRSTGAGAGLVNVASP